MLTPSKLANLEGSDSILTPTELANPEGSDSMLTPSKLANPEGSDSMLTPSELANPERSDSILTPSELANPEGSESMLTPSELANPEESDSMLTPSELANPEGSDSIMTPSNITTASVSFQTVDCSDTTEEVREYAKSTTGFIYCEDFSDYHLPKDPPEINLTSSEEFADFDAVILDFMKVQGIPGSSLCLAKDGKIIYRQTYGWATHGVRVMPNNRFRIASISKVITAAGIMKLVKEDLLSLNQRVFGPNGLLRQFSPAPRGDRRLLRVTVKHLLEHSAGWDRNMVGDPVFWKHIGAEMSVPEPVSQNDLISYMMTQKLQFTPGRKHVYSNLGYEVLGRVIEKVTGLSYRDYMLHLLTGVGIKTMDLGRTRKADCDIDEVEYFASPREQLLVDSLYVEDGTVPAPYGGFIMETGDADGGWIATATDLVQFLIALEGKHLPGILTPALFKRMLLKPSHARGSAWYGFGLEVSWNRKAWEHSGTLDGATSCLVRDRYGYTWAFLCNYWPPDSDYTSLVAYALTKVNHLCKVKQVFVAPADITTLDKKYCVNIKVPITEFESLSSAYQDLGYVACWLNGYEVQGCVFMNVIWTKNKKYLVYHSVNHTELRKLLDEHKTSYKVCHIDTYCHDQTIKYGVIFTCDVSTKWKLEIFYGLEELESHTKMFRDEGYHATRQSATVIGSKATIAVLYEQTHVKLSWAYMALTSEKYQSEFNRHSRYGHLISYVKPYHYNEQVFFSTIWTCSGAYKYSSEYDMTGYRLLNDLLFAFECKFYPVCISGYEHEDAHTFVCVCMKKVRKNSVQCSERNSV